MVAVFVIFLREGIEASMIVWVLLAFLDQIGQRRYFRDVLFGVAAALIVAAGGAVGIYFTIRNYDGTRFQTIFETGTYLLAAVILTYMTFWMRAHARSIATDLRSKAEDAMDGHKRLGLALLAFQAVGREGLETAIFTLAIVFANGSKGTVWGALGGLVVALCFAAAIYRFGRRINLGLFFKVIGSLLMVFAAGLVADIVENVQSLGWVRVLDHPLWSTSRFLSEGSSLGDVFHSLFGYADQPTALQLICYVVYLAVVIMLFTGFGRHRAASTVETRSASQSPVPPRPRAGGVNPRMPAT